MNKTELQLEFSEILTKKFKGLRVDLYHGRPYCSSVVYPSSFRENGKHLVQYARIEFTEYDWRDDGGGGTHNIYSIELFVTTLKGNAGRWVKYNL